MAKLELVTGPSGRVVDVPDLTTHCRIDAADEDAYLQILLDAAEDAAEDETWRRLLTQTWDQYFDEFEDPLYLRYPPLQSVTSVTYTDSNGDSQTLSTSIYEVGEENGIGVVRRKYNQTWPDTRSHEDVVTVRFVCGYGAAGDVPERIKHAIRIHAGWHFRNREGQAMPDTFSRLLAPFVAHEFQPIA